MEAHICAIPLRDSVAPRPVFHHLHTRSRQDTIGQRPTELGVN